MLKALRNWPDGELKSIPLEYLRSLSVAIPKDGFEHVRTYCMFLGHSRSGHSLIASLLDAHPNIVLADEVRALKFAAAGCGQERIFRIILGNTQTISAQERQRAGYKFQVPGQWQGRHQCIEVIGDKDGSWTATMALRNFNAIERLCAAITVPLRVLHIYRNPFDVISTIYRRHLAIGNSDPLVHSINYYFRRCEGIEKVRSCMPEESVLDVHYERFIADPATGLSSLCAFLGVQARQDYLDDCAGIVFDKPRRTREGIDWAPSDIAEVQDRLGRYDYLAEYRYNE